MTIQNKIEQLDKEMQGMNLPFDKGLHILQERLCKIAEEYNTTAPDIFMMYMNWKSGKSK